jgi:hypothetical protein
LLAQWKVSVTPPASGRPADVVAVLREAADSTAFEEDAVSLVIRCASRQLDAFLTTRDQLDSDMAGDVRLRVQADSLRAHDARWQATKSNAGAFVPANELRDLIQRGILRSAALRITAPTSKRGRVTYLFSVSGFRPALDALRDACPADRAALAEPPR